MRPQIARFAVVLGVVALGAGVSRCGGSSADLPLRTISFQAPGGGQLEARTADMRRAAQLELDAIDGDTGGSRLKIVDGPDPEAIATINALDRVAITGSDQLTINLNPPVRRETDAIPPLRKQLLTASQIWLLPPGALTAAATRSYAASGLPGASGAKADSPLRAGTPSGLYVTPALSSESYPPAGDEFFEKYKKKYGRTPDRYAIYAYEAVGLTVDALTRLEKAGKPVTRQSIAASALSIRDRFSPVGHYDVLPSGQTTLYLFQARGKGAPSGPASLTEALR